MTKKAENKTKQKTNTAPVIAKSDDGSIQITFTIPYPQIEENRKKAAQELGKDITVPGFRKGKAPLAKLVEHIPQNTLLEKTLSQILPTLLSETITKHGLKPAIYPKFELIKAVDNEDWQIRAATCELPEINLGDYKKKIQGAASSSKIWTPGKDADKKDEPTREQKEQQAIKLLLENIEVKVPKILVDEETNSRLSRLLEKLEKLGLNLDSYLASVNKTAPALRTEYETQSREALSLELILTNIAEKENIKPDEKAVEEALTIAGNTAPQENPDETQRKRLIEEILKRRSALDSVIALL
jgi:FKBP-type peptidyl-prolyl cis-trans isomerase (trigger factor)